MKNMVKRMPYVQDNTNEAMKKNNYQLNIIIQNKLAFNIKIKSYLHEQQKEEIQHEKERKRDKGNCSIKLTIVINRLLFQH